MNKLAQLTILAAIFGLIGCQSLQDRMSSPKEDKPAAEKDTKAKKLY